MDLTNYVDGPPDGTIVAAAPLNGVELEIANVIEAAGLTLSVADLTQLLQAIGGAIGLKSHATGTGTVSTIHTRALLASTGSNASGATSAVIASASSGASGGESAVIASDGSGASATGSAVLASGGGTASGARSAVVASYTSGASGLASAVLASGGGTASGDGSAVVASDDSTASGDAAAVVASTGSTASGDGAAVIASTGSYASGAGAICIGGQNVEVNTPGMIGGGDNSGASAITPGGINQGMKWNMDGAGQLVCQLLRLNSLETYADEAAAVTGGTLQTGDIYMTAAGAIRIKL